MNKNKLYTIIGIIVLVLSITGSLAYYFWKSGGDILLSGNLCLPEIYFTGGATINGKLKPVTNREDGLIKEIEVNLHKTCNNDTAVMNLYLSLDLLPVELQENTFVYELYNGDNERISSGNFSDKKEGDTITLAENEIVTSDVSIYTLYIYIDGNRDNLITMSNKSFRFNIYGEGTGAIYKENVIQNETTTPSSSSSTFLNTEVLRNEIESITIEKSNVVPSDAKYSKDISSKQDGSVMLWYTDKDNNNLYEVSIGSENGSLEANTNGSGMFAYLDNVDTLNLSGLDTSNMTSMSRMFYNSTSLKNVDLSGFDTSKVVNMSAMFEGCNNLENLDLSSFKTENVLNMSWMFCDCWKIEKLDLSSFRTAKLTDMNRAFRNCNSLQEIDLSSFDTSNVINMYAAFQGCESLLNLDLSNFDTSKVNNMGSTFEGCNSLSELNISSFDTSNVTNMGSMFRGCGSIEKLDLSNFDTSKVVSMSYMFGGTAIKEINLSSFNTSNVTVMTSMFTNCHNIVNLDLSNFNTKSVTDMSGMFWGANNLNTIYVSDLWSILNVTNSSDMFWNCTSLIGAVPFDSTKTDVSMANYTTGYLTKK